MVNNQYEVQKYNFHIVRKQAQLPEDVNIIVEDIAKKYGSEKLLKEMQRVRTRKLFGELLYYTPNWNIVLAKFEYADGICKRYILKMYDNNPYAEQWKSGDCHVLFDDMKLNYVIDIRKPKEELDG